MNTLRRLEASLQGRPDAWLTTALVAVGVTLLLVALLAPATVKALILAWAVFP